MSTSPVTLPLVSEADMQQIRHRRCRRSIVVCALVVGVILVAGPSQGAKFAGAFMENGGGARALAMGGAFTAVGSDASTTFWNPAAIGRFDHREVMLMHSERFGDLVDRDFASGVFPLDMSLFGETSGALGVTVIRLGIDHIPFTDHLLECLDGSVDGVEDGQISDLELQNILDADNQARIRYKSDQEFAAMLSYGERRGRWFLGGTLKMIHQSVGKYSSLGIGADLGALRPNLIGNLDFGLKLQDITTTYLSWSTGTNEVIYPAIVPAFAYRIALPRARMQVLLASSVECRLEDRGDADQWDAGDFSFNSHWGAEVGFSEKVFVRAGADSGFDTADLTAGAGLLLGPVMVDYAYAGDVLDIDEVTHRVSLAFHW